MPRRRKRVDDCRRGRAADGGRPDRTAGNGSERSSASITGEESQPYASLQAPTTKASTRVVVDHVQQAGERSLPSLQAPVDVAGDKPGTGFRFKQRSVTRLVT